VSGYFSKLLSQLASPELVCRGCLTKSDQVLSPCGDFACCERCQRSITSKDGYSVWRRLPQ